MMNPPGEKNSPVNLTNIGEDSEAIDENIVQNQLGLAIFGTFPRSSSCQLFFKCFIIYQSITTFKKEVLKKAFFFSTFFLMLNTRGSAFS